MRKAKFVDSAIAGLCYLLILTGLAIVGIGLLK